MRQIILDTETTGLDPKQGHRLIEVGCLEMRSRQVTDSVFHCYLDPERGIDPAAQRVHGISRSFLQGKPLFSDVVDDFLAFIEGAELIIHNAPFDLGFLDSELKRAKKAISLKKRHKVIDTLKLAKQKHPGQKNNLDALCKRYDIDNRSRTLHGALLDARLLASVYLAMTSGQESLFDALDATHLDKVEQGSADLKANLRSSHTVILQKASPEELKAHEAYMRDLKD